jgi:transcriptional regulator with XRE-family HTH domain
VPKRKQTTAKTSPFSERMAVLRKQKGMRMEELGKLVKVSKSYISLLEAGERQPSRDVVIKLAEALFPEGHESGRDELLILAGFAPVNMDAVSVYKDLLDIYEQALQKDPDDFRTYTMLVFALIKAGRYEQAREKIQQASVRFTETVQMLALSSILELSKGNYETAILNQQTAIQNFHLRNGELTGHVQLPDLLFHLGDIFFIRGFHFLGEYVAAKHEGKIKAAKAAKDKAMDDFHRACQEFEAALTADATDVYVLDEYARVNFNLAFLLDGVAAQPYWERAIHSFRQVFLSRQKYHLGQQALMESGAFLAHAYAKSQRFEEAEFTIGLLGSFYQSYWLLHYIEACLYNLRYEADAQPEYLDYALEALELAMQVQDPKNQTATEAHVDPDLATVRKLRAKAFAQIVPPQGDLA